MRTDDDSGERTSTRQLALDLRYLVTAYGSKAYHAEALLGHALLALHDHPLLTRDYIAESLAVPVASVAIDKHLAASGLAEQVESIRLSIDKLSADDLARLWSGFQSGMRPSVSVLASVMLLSSRTELTNPIPIATRSIDPKR